MREIGKTISFATSYNSKNKHDGDEFMREMRKFSDFLDGKDNIEKALEKPGKWVPNLREQFERSFLQTEKIQTFAFFMHGSWRALYGLDHNIWTTDRVARRIWYEKSDEPINIVLYACGCGGGTKKWKNIHEYHLGSRWDMRGEFGFAMRLAHDLSDIGVHDYRIFAHIGSGHVTERPFCVWITEENQIVKRREIVPFRSWASSDRKGRRQWLRWVKFIQETKDGRFRAPFLTEEELAEVIGD